MEKLNQGNKCIEHNDYNEIYQSHTQLFLDLLQPRLGNAYDYYVRMPEVEDEILSYIFSGMKPICLFSGLTGIGKTSILNHIKNVLEEKGDIHCIYLDLVGRRAKLELGEDFNTLDEYAKKARTETISQEYLIRMLLGSFHKRLPTERWGEEFYVFIMNKSPHLIFDISMHSGEDAQAKISVLEKFREDNPLAHAYLSLKYYCSCTEKKHVTVILDNTDQKDFELIESFVNILADFNVCIGREINKVTSIISCRPYNEKRLQKRREINSLSSHGDRTISITKPCGISRIIRERKEKGDFETNPLYIETSKGAKWTVKEVGDFIDNLTSRYEQEGLEDLVVELNNYDLSLAFDNTVNVLRNKFFVSAERLLPNVINEGSDLPFGVSLSAVLKSLAYGNPKNRKVMFYPSDNAKMPIPNLLNWNPDQPSTFLSKMRVVQYLVNKKATVERNGLPQESIVNSLRKYFNIDDKQALKCLKIMYLEKLIFTHSNRSPEQNGLDFIVLSPRGNLLFRLIQKSSLMMEFWFDDTPISDDILEGTFLNHGFSERFSALLEFLEFIWSQEERQISSILRVDGLPYSFRNDYGSGLISRRLLRGLKSSTPDFYPALSEEQSGKIEGLRRSMDYICDKLQGA